MNILEQIVQTKREELDLRKKDISLEGLKQLDLYNTPGRSLKKSFEDPDKVGIIAEFKRKSPSKGWFSKVGSPVNIVHSYEANGANAISVLTDQDYFGGSLNDLKIVRQTVNCPLLRKDFMIDSFQLHEAKAYGADIILLIAAILSKHQVAEMAQEAKQIGLEVLLEIHNESELDHIVKYVDFVGVNNRDLKTFSVNIDQSVKLSKMIPDQYIKISESGIDSIETIQRLKKEDFKGFLLGERFMKESDPAIAFAEFAQLLKHQ